MMKLRTPILIAFVMISLFSALRAQAKEGENRLTPTEIESVTPIAPGAGTSGLAGIKTRVLKGDLTRPGLYTIQLTIPANTTIQAHDHPDDRIATVISGTWYIGYGNKFDDKKLKALPPGSFYTEVPHDMHFAMTRDTPVVVMITGYGPTGTKYFEANANYRVIDTKGISVRRNRATK